jgi:hypothetical protein
MAPERDRVDKVRQRRPRDCRQGTSLEKETIMSSFKTTSTRVTARVVALGLALTLLAACQSSLKVGPEAVAGLRPDGTIDMQQVQVAYIGSGSGGSGTFYYRGNAYPFSIGGVGIGGIGASTIDAQGEVYKLSSLANFPGTYAQARYGFAVGTASGGDLWMQNEAGVILHLKAKRTGLMLSLGGDAVVISMTR